MGTPGTLSAPNQARGRTPVSALLVPGARLGRYELVLPLTGGGMGQVWIAKQDNVGFSRIVAVKTIRPELSSDHGSRRMFLDEAQIAARIRHTNVVEVLDVCEVRAIILLVMPLIEGDSVTGLLRRLRERGDRNCLPHPIALRILADAAAGLHAAHELTDDDGNRLGLVHRDVSPQNILVGLDGVAKLSDFGIAKALGRMADETGTGQMKGKLSYISPEQAEMRPIDLRSDVFAAGIVLWEALTGERLFRGDDAIETLQRIASQPVPDPRTIVPTIPAAAAEATMRALERVRAERFPTAAAFGAALEASGPATSIDVAAFVDGLVRDDVEALRLAVRRARAPRPTVPHEVLQVEMASNDAAGPPAAATSEARDVSRPSEVHRASRSSAKRVLIAIATFAFGSAIALATFRGPRRGATVGAPTGAASGAAETTSASAPQSSAPIDSLAGVPAVVPLAPESEPPRPVWSSDVGRATSATARQRKPPAPAPASAPTVPAPADAPQAPQDPKSYR